MSGCNRFIRPRFGPRVGRDAFSPTTTVGGKAAGNAAALGHPAYSSLIMHASLPPAARRGRVRAGAPFPASSACSPTHAHVRRGKVRSASLSREIVVGSEVASAHVSRPGPARSSSAVHRGNPAPRRASGPLSQGDPAHLAQTVHPSSSGPSVRADSAGTLQADVGVRGRDAPLGRSNDEGHPGVPGTSPFASDDDEDYRMTVVEGLTRQHVATTFRWPAALGGSQVSVTGSFCNWERLLRMTRSSSTGDFVLTLVRRSAPQQWPGKLCAARASMSGDDATRCHVVPCSLWSRGRCSTSTWWTGAGACRPRTGRCVTSAARSTTSGSWRRPPPCTGGGSGRAMRL